MFILGVSYGYTATATILHDGVIIACASEERFCGVKNFNGFPKQAIDYCLKEANITASQLDLVTTPYQYLPPSHLLAGDVLLTPNKGGLVTNLRQIHRQLRYRFPIIRPLGIAAYRVANIILGRSYTRAQAQQISEYLGINRSKVIAFDHHLCHAASAYYASPFNTQKALVFTLDGEGDNTSASISIADSRGIKVISHIPREFSLGYIYGHVTKYLGMKPHEHEYKVMGLAAYAKPSEVDKIYQLLKPVISLDPSDNKKFTMPINSQDFDLFLKDKLTNVRFDNLAGAVQKLTEELVAGWVRAAIRDTGIHTIVLGGGVFMNIKANQVINNLSEVRKIFIMPSCADESAPIGSAYLGSLQLKNSLKISPITNLYWGPQYTHEEILKELTLHRTKVKFTKIKDIETRIAKLLADKQVVAVFSGRMEWGARALGNRSILAHPQELDSIRVINSSIKSRDFWMPFAPVILDKYADKYIVNPKNTPAPYMILGFNSTALAKKHLKAALHQADLTLRPQVISKEFNSRYYKIIEEFSKITGIGGLLNTSFNLHGLPVVMNPKQALHAFLNSELQYLAIGPYLVSKHA